MSIIEPKSNVLKVSKLTTLDTLAMHRVFVKYYHNADIDTFLNDLSKKQYVLIMRDRATSEIVGFSTIALLNMDLDGHQAVGLFSGDTVLEEPYWGARRWQFTWGLFCIWLRIRYFRRPFFWLLISKGYKTYMLLANNFVQYYPKEKSDNKDLAKVVDMYCSELFPEAFDVEKRILDFGDKYQHLQDGVADIGELLVSQESKIRFFEECNPEWRRGTELPCVGVFEFKMLTNYVKKMLKGRVSKASKDKKQGRLENSGEGAVR